jgi:glycosyltransferase involved in cell wall biosynthesis
MAAPDRSLDVLYAGPLPPQPGGAAIMCGQLLVGLARLRHRVRAVAPVTRDAQDGEGGALLGVEITRYLVPSFVTNAAVPGSSTYWRRERKRLGSVLARLIDHARPDVLIMGQETFAWSVPDVALPRSIPSVLLVHGAPSRAILDGTYPAALATELLTRYRAASLIVAVAAHWAERLRTLGLVAVETIPNPVDLDRFAPGPRDPALARDLGIVEDAVVVTHVAHLKPVKRPMDVVVAAELALSSDPRLVFVIVGDGECRVAMEAACHAKGIAPRFRFVGWVAHERVPAYINLADLVVLPSEHETQALVCLETQACGRVIVASNLPGAREVIADGETGLLFRKGDPGDLARVILYAAGNPALRAEIGRRARKRVRTHALSKTVAAYAAILARVVRQHARCRRPESSTSLRRPRIRPGPSRSPATA